VVLLSPEVSWLSLLLELLLLVMSVLESRIIEFRCSQTVHGAAQQRCDVLRKTKNKYPANNNNDNDNDNNNNNNYVISMEQSVGTAPCATRLGCSLGHNGK
jgi:hypothetical protein